MRRESRVFLAILFSLATTALGAAEAPGPDSLAEVREVFDKNGIPVQPDDFYQSWAVLHENPQCKPQFKHIIEDGVPKGQFNASTECCEVLFKMMRTDRAWPRAFTATYIPAFIAKDFEGYCIQMLEKTM